MLNGLSLRYASRLARSEQRITVKLTKNHLLLRLPMSFVSHLLHCLSGLFEGGESRISGN